MQASMEVRPLPPEPSRRSQWSWTPASKAGRSGFDPRRWHLTSVGGYATVTFMSTSTKSRIIDFTDGTFFEIPVEWKNIDPDKIVGIEEGGECDLIVYRTDGMDITLTPCCGASFKGCDGYIGCRACYRDLDGLSGGLPSFGGKFVVWRSDLPEAERVVV